MCFLLIFFFNFLTNIWHYFNPYRNLKTKNALKKSVRASFNRDSSFEFDESSIINSTKVHDGLDSADKSLPFNIGHCSTEDITQANQSQVNLNNSSQLDEHAYFEKHLLFSKSASESYR